MIEWLKLQFESWIERRDLANQCDSCNILKEQLFQANNDRTKLLEQLIELTNPARPVEESPQDFKPIAPRIVPWHIKRQLLEAEARAEAEILRKNKASGVSTVKDLEEEVMKLADERLQDNG